MHQLTNQPESQKANIQANQSANIPTKQDTSPPPPAWILEFVEQAIFRLQESVDRIEICLGKLTEEELWTKPNEVSNSIGTLILHVCGNAKQYMIASLGGDEDTRNRPQEFSLRDIPKANLLADTLQLLQEIKHVLQQIKEEELLRMRMVQGFRLSGMGIVIHVVEHFSYHTGQIAFWTKAIKNKDLGFYAGYDLNIK